MLSRATGTLTGYAIEGESRALDAGAWSSPSEDYMSKDSNLGLGGQPRPQRRVFRDNRGSGGSGMLLDPEEA